MDLLPDASPQPAEPARIAGRVRAMRRSDMDGVTALFFAAFRGNRRRKHPDFAPYFERLFFDGPTGDGSGGIVVPGPDGGLLAAAAFLPMRFLMEGQGITARLCCAFMAQPQAPLAAARLTMATRARTQDLFFSDSASTVSLRHLVATGGHVLPVESLDWLCRLRPAAALAARAGLPPALVRALAWAESRLRPRPTPGDDGETTILPLPRDAYVALAPRMIAHFAVRPEWSPEEMGWLLDRAAENRTLGVLRFFAFHARDGQAIGCMAAYEDRFRRVRVLDLLPLPGHEARIAAALHARFVRAGVPEASGTAHPHLLAALSPLRGMQFRHRAFTCLGSRHEAVGRAVARNDIYIGGLAGEGWSRLMTDFH